jgi:hypothetical protein
MVEKAKLELIAADTSSHDSVFDDIEALRQTGTIKVSRRVVPVNVTVGKPKNSVYFRCHPDPQFSLDASIIVDAERNEDIYFVTPKMLDYHAVTPRLRRVTLAVVYTWPGGNVSIWPVPYSEESRIACWKTARVAYERSMTQWVQLVWNSDRRDYDLAVAEGLNTEPLWPDNLNLANLLKLGFAEKIISSPEHSYVMQLRGLTG